MMIDKMCLEILTKKQDQKTAGGKKLLLLSEMFILLFNYHVVFLREIGKGLVIKNDAKMVKIQKCRIFPHFFFDIFLKYIQF